MVHPGKAVIVSVKLNPSSQAVGGNVSSATSAVNGSKSKAMWQYDFTRLILTTINMKIIKADITFVVVE